MKWHTDLPSIQPIRIRFTLLFVKVVYTELGSFNLIWHFFVQSFTTLMEVYNLSVVCSILIHHYYWFIISKGCHQCPFICPRYDWVYLLYKTDSSVSENTTLNTPAEILCNSEYSCLTPILILYPWYKQFYMYIWYN